MNLNDPFPREMLRSVSKGGTSLTYIPVSEVIARLNDVLGEQGWSYQITDRWTTGDSNGCPEWVMTQVRVTVNHESFREAIGGQQVKFKRDGSGPVDIGDEWKGAVSDALKKAAQAFGVGLELARTDEAMQASTGPKPLDVERYGKVCEKHGLTVNDVAEAYGTPVEGLTEADLPALNALVKQLAGSKTTVQEAFGESTAPF